MYTLWHGDCLEEMSRIESGSVDMICADLPFNSTACTWDKLIPFDSLWKHYKRIIKSSGAVALFGKQPFTSALIMSNLEWFRQELIWFKVVGGDFPNANRRILPAHENILLFYRSLPTYNPQFTEKAKKDIRPPHKPALTTSLRPLASGIAINSKTYDPAISYPISVLTYHEKMAECNSRYRLHNTQKPVALLSYLILTYTNEGETVLDNTCGSGSTLEAAMRNNRHSIGIEKDAHYFSVAQQRLARVAAELRGELNHLPMFAEAA